jgi:hypothetical protein
MFVTFGCNGGQELDAESANSGASFGILSVSYVHDWSNDGGEFLLNASAQFVRYAAFDRAQVGRILGLMVDPAAELPGPDQCRLYEVSGDDGRSADGELGSVELLDAGEISLGTPNEEVTLLPRHFPGLLPFISGVIYGDGERVSFEGSTGSLSAASNGSAEVGKFTAQLAASPALPRLLGIGGQRAAEQTRIAFDRDLVIQWDASRASAQDLTFIEISQVRGSDWNLRCRVSDDGSFSIPFAQLQQLKVADGEKVDLVISRLRREAFDAPGLNQAELRLALRDRATIRVR